MSSRFDSPSPNLRSPFIFLFSPPPLFGSTALDGKGGGEEVAQDFLLACAWRAFHCEGYGEQRQRERERGEERWDKLVFV